MIILPKGWYNKPIGRHTASIHDDENTYRFLIARREGRDGPVYFSAQRFMETVAVPTSKFTDLETAMKRGLLKCKLGVW